MEKLIQSKPLKEGINFPTYKKWDIVSFGSRSERIVIGIDSSFDRESLKVMSTTYTLYPYKRKKTKLGKWLWFKWLKVRIFLNIIKTS